MCVCVYPCVHAVGEIVMEICGAVAFGWGITVLRSDAACDQNDEDTRMTSQVLHDQVTHGHIEIYLRIKKGE